MYQTDILPPNAPPTPPLVSDLLPVSPITHPPPPLSKFAGGSSPPHFVLCPLTFTHDVTAASVRLRPFPVRCAAHAWRCAIWCRRSSASWMAMATHRRSRRARSDSCNTLFLRFFFLFFAHIYFFNDRPLFHVFFFLYSSLSIQTSPLIFLDFMSSLFIFFFSFNSDLH